MKLYQYNILSEIITSIDDIQSLIDSILQINNSQSLTDDILLSYLDSIKQDSKSLKSLVLKLF